MTTYNSQADPRLGQVNKQRVLGPALGGLDLLKREVGAVLLEMDLNDQGNTSKSNVRVLPRKMRLRPDFTHASRLPWCLDSSASASSLRPCA